MMRWMRINEQQNLIPAMCTSKRVSSYFAADRPTDFQCKPALHCLKMSILKHIKQPGLSALQDLNGVTQLLNRHLQDPLLVRQLTDGVDLLK